MQTHSLPYIETLLDVANSAEGGRTLAVIGDPNVRGYYWAGARFSPVNTLFEAVLRCLLCGKYERIVAFTGAGDGRLPKWKLGANFTLGDEAVVWMVKGESKKRAKNKPSASANPFESTAVLEQFKTDKIERLIWRSERKAYWDRLEAYNEQVAKEIAEASGKRMALLLDYRFLAPDAQEAAEIMRGAIEQRRSNGIRAGFERDLTGSSVDLILFGEHSLALDLVEPESQRDESVIARMLAGYATSQQWEQLRPRLAGALPPLQLQGRVDPVPVARSAGPLPGSLLELEDSPERLYVLFRGSRINKRPSIPTPPTRSNEIALEFWANIDLKPLEQAFEERIFGQTEAKRVILDVLRKQREVCAQILELAPGAVRTAEDKECRLPVIALFGAAGMGKTTFCKILASHLFGDEEYALNLDLSGKGIEAETIGVRPPYIGCDQESTLIQFARKTRGLGLVCFDEFTRIELPERKNLASSLGALFQPLQDRYFTPANPSFQPPGRRFHMANTLFVFSGNVARTRQQAGQEFVSMEDLGQAFISRMERIVFFNPLTDEELKGAMISALRRNARGWARKFMPDLFERLDQNIEIADELLELIRERFEQRVSASSGEPSLRILDNMLQDLSYRQAVERCAGDGRLTLTPDIVPESWR